MDVLYIFSPSCFDLHGSVPGIYGQKGQSTSCFGQQSFCSCQHIRARSSRACSLRQIMAYGGGTLSAVTASWEWWLFTNFPARYGLVVGVVASVLVSVSLGGSRDVTVQREWLSIVGCLLSWSRPRCPNSPGRVEGIGCGRFDRIWLLVMILIP